MKATRRQPDEEGTDDTPGVRGIHVTELAFEEINAAPAPPETAAYFHGMKRLQHEESWGRMSQPLSQGHRLGRLPAKPVLGSALRDQPEYRARRAPVACASPSVRVFSATPGRDR